MKQYDISKLEKILEESEKEIQKVKIKHMIDLVLVVKELIEENETLDLNMGSASMYDNKGNNFVNNNLTNFFQLILDDSEKYICLPFSITKDNLELSQWANDILIEQLKNMEEKNDELKQILEKLRGN